MLLVAVEFRVAPEDRPRFAEIAGALTDSTRAEPGCRFFEFWSDLAESGRFLVHEGWESAADLELHRETPHVAAFKVAVGEIGIAGMTASYYDAVETSV